MSTLRLCQDGTTGSQSEAVMKPFKAFPLCAFALLSVSCYDFVSQTTVMPYTEYWRRAAPHTLGNSSGGGVIGLAGQDIFYFAGNSWTKFDDYLLDEFGGPYVLTSVAQTHTVGHHEHTFIHGNLVYQDDELSLLYTSGGSPYSMSWVDPWTYSFYADGEFYAIKEICDMAASSTGEYGHPSDPSSHLYVSFRARNDSGPGAYYVGGVMEISFTSGMDYWWPRPTGSGDQVWIHQPDNTFFSNECMPIAVTGRGDQTEQYLVVGDRSMDELSVFDAYSIASGPVDSVRTPTSEFRIVELAIEGRGDGSTNYGFLVTLWRGSSGAKLEHTWIMNGDLDDGGPHLVESVPTNISHITSRGLGVENPTEQLYTFGNQVMRRYYEQ